MKNKLTLIFVRVLPFLFVFFLFSIQSCKKDTIYPIDTSVRLDKQLINQSELQEWFETNPAGQLLSPDWKHAKQAIVNGQNVVRIPTLNIDKTYLLRMLKMQS